MEVLLRIVRFIGSLWLGALVLLLLLLAMACATVYESSYNTERALAVFYRAWWFKGLLGLLCVNILASLSTRLTAWKRQIGFVVTHVAILTIVGGAWVTQEFGLDGQTQIAEGQTADSFSVPEQILLASRPHDGLENEVELSAAPFGGFEPADVAGFEPLALGDAQFAVERYLPDSEWRQEVRRSDKPALPAAIEVSLGPPNAMNSRWLFARRGDLDDDESVVFRQFDTQAELEAALADAPASAPGDSLGAVRVSVDGKEHVIPLEDCLEKNAAVVDTDYRVHVLRYLPHASVGDNKQLVNASDDPVNPAVEVELSRGDKTVRRVAFARFPGFMHVKDDLADVPLTFEQAARPARRAPLEILRSPTGEFHVRFEGENKPVQIRRMELGEPAETPWMGWVIALSQYYEHADQNWLADAVPVRADRHPAVLIKITAPNFADQVWVRKYEPRPVLVNDMPYQLVYADRQIPLGFSVKLNKLTIGRYPGESMPRSYESQITTIDPTTGREQNRIVSMNNPAEHGGYKFFQSAVNQAADGTPITILGVSRDPGQPIVFSGYYLLMAGLVILLITRMLEKRAAAATSQRPAALNHGG